MAKKIVITGATSGIGKVAALELASQGHHIVTLSRNPEKSQVLLDDFEDLNTSSEGKIEIVKGDLAILKSMENAINRIRELIGVPDILINNAGIWNFSFNETADHIEETFQVNVIAPSLITHAFLPEMVKRRNRLIFTSSGLHQGEVNFEDIEFRNKYSGFSAYRQSKLCNIMLSRYLADKYGALGLKSYSQHPGMVNTQLGRDAPWLARVIFQLFGLSPEKGSKNLVYLSNESEENLENGAYYVKEKPKSATSYSRNMKETRQLVQRIESMSPPELLKGRRLFELS